jgi:hypothetical protein
MQLLTELRLLVYSLTDLMIICLRLHPSASATKASASSGQLQIEELQLSESMVHWIV